LPFAIYNNLKTLTQDKISSTETKNIGSKFVSFHLKQYIQRIGQMGPFLRIGAHATILPLNQSHLYKNYPKISNFSNPRQTLKDLIVCISILLVSRSGQEEADQFECLQPNELRLRAENLENTFDTALKVESGNQSGGMVAHQ